MSRDKLLPFVINSSSMPKTRWYNGENIIKNHEKSCRRTLNMFNISKYDNIVASVLDKYST